MKYFILLSIFFSVNEAAAQQSDLDLWKRKYKNILTVQDLKKRMDSLKALSNYNPLPNAFTKILPSPKLIGNNGNGNDIYILPIDNMPMIKPDSTFSSNMPNGIRRSK